MAHRLRSIGVAALLVTLGACSGPSQPACRPGTGSPMAVFTLYLGKAIPGRPDLTDQEWLSFQERTVTALLPHGYTVLDANGAWMNPTTHRTTREATKVLIAALPDTQDSLTAINRVRSEYQVEFHQQLVGMTVQPACAAF